MAFDIDEFQELKKRINAMKEIIKVNDPEGYEKLCDKDYTWAPETKQERYADWLSYNYPVDPNNLFIVSIYSVFYNKPLAEMRIAMEDALKQVDAEYKDSQQR